MLNRDREREREREGGRVGERERVKDKVSFVSQTPPNKGVINMVPHALKIPKIPLSRAPYQPKAPRTEHDFGVPFLLRTEPGFRVLGLLHWLHSTCCEGLPGSNFRAKSQACCKKGFRV